MHNDDVTAFVEAALLTTRGPVTVPALVAALVDDEVADADVERALDAIGERYREAGRGVRLEKVAGGWRCVTVPTLDGPLRALHGQTARQRLSQAALEVLSVVAYRQPVTLPEVNFVRGANSTKVMRTLLDRGLVRMAGRKKVVGKPFLYRTTKEFLIHFGLDDLGELPAPEDLIEDSSAEAD